jgi:hypothetical protein
MTTALILIASGILIGAGIGVIWRDVKRTRRRAFVLQRDTQSAIEPEVEIVISRGDADASLPRPATRQVPSPHTTANGLAVATLSEPANDGSAQPAQSSALSLEQQWAALKPKITIAHVRETDVISNV